jgi:hypothetical protein
MIRGVMKMSSSAFCSDLLLFRKRKPIRGIFERNGTPVLPTVELVM